MPSSTPGQPSATQLPNYPTGPRPADGQYRIQLTRVTSFIFMTQWSTTTCTGDLARLEAAARSARVHNLLLGWWSITGLIRTPMALAQNASAIRRVRDLVSGKC
jgi:hypothetical protein